MIDLIENKINMPEMGSLKYEGVVDDTIKFVQEKQLKDIHYWKLFVEQYRKGNVDDKDNGWRGEYWGKMMRGASLTYIYTQDEELYKILEDSVYDLLTTQDSLGRFSTYSIENEFKEWDIWSRKYILLGSIYFIDICKNDELKAMLIKAMIRHADYIISKVGSEEEGKIPITKTSKYWNGLNSSSILEPIVRLYVLTGLDRYLKFAEHIVECGGTDGFNIFKAAYENKLYPYQYPVTKAYEMISNFEGLIWYYRVTGKTEYLTAAVNFADKVHESDITVIGSAGCTHELFDHSIINQFDPSYDGIMQETCVTVTWLKYCYQLLQITGDQKYAEWIEISTYNALLGAINTEENKRINMVPVFDSYSPLRKGVRGKATGGLKDIDENTYYGCCIAIGAAGTALSALSSFGKTENGFCINMYIPGVINSTTPKGNEIKLKINTEYPIGDTINIEMKLQQPEKFTVNFRVPSYGLGGILHINGKAVKNSSITRVWRDGDKITIVVDTCIRLLKDTDILPEAENREKRYGVLLKGPIVLATDANFNNDIDKALSFKTNDRGFILNPYILVTKDKTKLAYNIITSNGSVYFANYSYCGKTWDDSMPMAAWVLLD